MLRLLRALSAALPDAITAAVFMTAWIVPQRIGVEQIGNLGTVMLIEFLVVHSSGFYAAILAATKTARAKRVMAMFVLMAVYGLLTLLFWHSAKDPWPIYAFLWLLASRFAHVLLAPVDSEQNILREVRLWAVSVGAYIFSAFAAILLPLPPLGFTAEVISAVKLDAHGDWSTHPYKLLAFGALYFAIQAWAKFDLGAAPPRAKLQG